MYLLAVHAIFRVIVVDEAKVCVNECFAIIIIFSSIRISTLCEYLNIAIFFF